MQQATEIPGVREIAEEWDRRAKRTGLAKVMRASQPDNLADDTTARTTGIVSDYLRSVGTRTALEIGCGMGRLTPVIARNARQVTAIDMTSRMIDLARVECAELPHVRFLRTTVQRLPWQHRRFDVAVCVWVLMHVLDEDELAKACRAISAAARNLVLIEYEHADIPVGRYSRLRDVDDYLALLPGSRLIERRELSYGGDRSFAALIDLGSR
nr:class I SAM-dependent methyltransferase [Kibdelosporangium sp. MJ126-NF4]CEL19854.1 hypothetical protein [Kibdelosporangium sp. MJ126-NF4]CTQ97078.1 hypothetical protein [Kibdelosporangium sp. MJ126-NF4]